MPMLMLLRGGLPALSALAALHSGPTTGSPATLVRRYERDLGVAAVHAAIPSFSRETGLPCSACHTTFPQLNAFGRAFKMNGYTLTDSQVVSDSEGGKRETLRLDLIPALSAMVQTSISQVRTAVPETQNGAVQFPQQLSLFLGGAITPRLGTFVQVTYDPADGGIAMDNAEVRYADRTALGSRSLVYGFTLNNNPTMQDVWNTVPAWGFPYAASAVAPAPAAGVLLDGALGQQVAGLGAYALLGSRLYGEFSAYRSAFQGGPNPPDATASNVVHGAAPYWRAFYQVPIGAQTLMIGTLGMNAALYPQGVTGLDNQFTDVGFDAQYERSIGGGTLTAHGLWMHERQSLSADVASGAAANTVNTLRTVRFDASVYSRTRLGLTAGYFATTGTADALRYPAGDIDGSATGSPDSQGFIAEVSALPWQNTRFELQYVGYTKFNGASLNYDGSGRNAKDNNTVYLLVWMAF